MYMYIYIYIYIYIYMYVYVYIYSIKGIFKELNILFNFLIICQATMPVFSIFYHIFFK